MVHVMTPATESAHPSQRSPLFVDRVYHSGEMKVFSSNQKQTGDDQIICRNLQVPLAGQTARTVTDILKA